MRVVRRDCSQSAVVQLKAPPNANGRFSGLTAVDNSALLRNWMREASLVGIRGRMSFTKLRTISGASSMMKSFGLHGKAPRNRSNSILDTAIDRLDGRTPLQS